MANLDFFATRADHEAIVNFLYTHTDVRIFESYSDYGQELREFTSWEQLTGCFDVGVDPHGNGLAILLDLWSPSVMDRLEIERIALNPRYCEGHTFRYRIEGWGLIQLYLGGIHRQVITKSHYGHNSEKRAEAWGHASEVNWAELKKLSNKIQYHIRSRLAVARVPGRPVLPEAYRLARRGYALKESANAPGEYRLPPVDGTA